MANRSAARIDEPALASRLQASWQRSRHYGVPQAQIDPVFTGDVDTSSLLYECGRQVLSGLQATLANEPLSLMVADSEGLVLTRLTNDKAITTSLDKVHLAPGFYYSERNAGTNGLGLALADRAPTLVRADQHYCEALQGYTCAAAPVIDPLTGDLAGSINLTTWSDSSSELLLALAQMAAGNTAALMLVRAGGRTMRPAPRGEVFHVQMDRLPSREVDPCVSRSWRQALAEAQRAQAVGRILAVVGEPGVGKAALATLARRGVARSERILGARPPAPDDVDSWLALWTPELSADDTCVIVSGVDSLPAWAAGDLARTFGSVRRDSPFAQPFVVTARDFASIPESLAALVDTVVEIPPLRFRTDDVLALARLFARQERHREVTFTARAARVLTTYDWPGNVRQLRRVVREAAARADVVDAQHLAAEVFGGTHTLSRLETLERDEIVRCLSEPGVTMVQAAEMLGVSRATLYRKIAQYDIRIPGKS